MSETASESFGRPEIESRLWVTGAALLCATATLGVVVNATAPRLMTSRAPGIGDALRINAGYLTLGSAATTAVLTVAGLLALYWSVRETWPWLILAGVIASLPGEAISVIPEFQLLIGFTSLQAVFALTTAAAQLTLLGVLAGATRLVRIRTAPAGAMLFAAAGYVRSPVRSSSPSPSPASPDRPTRSSEWKCSSRCGCGLWSPLASS